MKTVIGLDLSLTGTGVVVLSAGGKILEKTLIKSKPIGDTPKEELERIQKIVEAIAAIVDKHTTTIAVIENLAFATRNTTSLTQLAGLSFLTRAMLHDRGIPFYLCAPTTLKRFATGKGNSEKDHMILEAYKQFGLEENNNIADALFLAKIGEMIAKKKRAKNQYQQETIKLLSTQHEHKCKSL